MGSIPIFNYTYLLSIFSSKISILSRDIVRCLWTLQFTVRFITPWTLRKNQLPWLYWFQHFSDNSASKNSLFDSKQFFSYPRVDLRRNHFSCMVEISESIDTYFFNSIHCFTKLVLKIYIYSWQIKVRLWSCNKDPVT